MAPALQNSHAESLYMATTQWFQRRNITHDPRPYDFTGHSYPGPQTQWTHKQNNCIWPKPNECIGRTTAYGPKPNKFIGRTSAATTQWIPRRHITHDPKPYDFTGHSYPGPQTQWNHKQNNCIWPKPKECIGRTTAYGPKPNKFIGRTSAATTQWIPRRRITHDPKPYDFTGHSYPGPQTQWIHKQNNCIWPKPNGHIANNKTKILATEAELLYPWWTRAGTAAGKEPD